MNFLRLCGLGGIDHGLDYADISLLRCEKIHLQAGAPMVTEVLMLRHFGIQGCGRCADCG